MSNLYIFLLPQTTLWGRNSTTSSGSCRFFPESSPSTAPLQTGFGCHRIFFLFKPPCCPFSLTVDAFLYSLWRTTVFLQTSPLDILLMMFREALLPVSHSLDSIQIDSIQVAFHRVGKTIEVLMVAVVAAVVDTIATLTQVPVEATFLIAWHSVHNLTPWQEVNTMDVTAEGTTTTLATLFTLTIRTSVSTITTDT